MRHHATNWASNLLLVVTVAACGGAQSTASTTTAQPAPAQPAPEHTAATSSPQTNTTAVTPAAATAELRNNRVEISQMVEFQENSEALHQRSDEILNRVIEVLHAHPEIHALRIEGHTDNLGSPEHNQHLSEGRARAVARYLHDHGVTIRIDTAGFGATHALCSENTEECRLRNRRVDFVVTDPAAAGTASAGGAAAH